MDKKDSNKNSYDVLNENEESENGVNVNWGNIGEEVGEEVGEIGGETAGKDIGEYIGEKLGAFIGGKIEGEAGKEIGAKLGKEIGEYIGEEVGEIGGKDLGGYIGEKIGKDIGEKYGKDVSKDFVEKIRETITKDLKIIDNTYDMKIKDLKTELENKVSKLLKDADEHIDVINKLREKNKSKYCDKASKQLYNVNIDDIIGQTFTEWFYSLFWS